MKKILIGVLTVLSLCIITSCGKEEQKKEEVKKQKINVDNKKSGLSDLINNGRKTNN